MERDLSLPLERWVLLYIRFWRTKKFDPRFERSWEILWLNMLKKILHVRILESCSICKLSSKKVFDRCCHVNHERKWRHFFIISLSYGMHRLPRVSPHVPLQCIGWKILANVRIERECHPKRQLSILIANFHRMHTNPQMYEKLFEFIPDRWLGDVNLPIKKSFVPFSQGSVHCLGIK